MEKDVTFGYESALDRFHRIIKWLIIVIVILIFALIGTNLAWVIYENQYEDVSVKVEQEADEGNNSYVGDNGVIVNN